MCAFQTVEDLRPSLLFSRLVECYKIYFICSVPALLNHWAVAWLQMFVVVLEDFKAGIQICPSLQRMSSNAAEPQWTVCTPWYPEAFWTTVSRCTRLLASSEIYGRSEGLLSSVVPVHALFSVVSGFTVLYHCYFCWPLPVYKFSPTSDDSIIAVCVLYYTLPLHTLLNLSISLYLSLSCQSSRLPILYQILCSYNL